MYGAEFTIPDKINISGRKFDEVDYILKLYNKTGLITGIPSLRNESSYTTLQTLDKLAKGIRISEKEKNYAMIVLADPAQDAEISELIQVFLELKSEIHQYLSYRLSDTANENDSKFIASGFNIGVIFEALTVASLVTGNPIAATGFATVSKFLPISQIGISRGKHKSIGSSTGINLEYRDFIVKYCEDLIDKHIKRMERGRNLGFWQTGVYVLAEDNATNDAVLGMLRSIYSGKESYIEPIRVFNSNGNEEVKKFICGLNFLPLPEIATSKEQIRKDLGIEHGWHVFGRMCKLQPD